MFPLNPTGPRWMNGSPKDEPPEYTAMPQQSSNVRSSLIVVSPPREKGHRDADGEAQDEEGTCRYDY